MDEPKLRPGPPGDRSQAAAEKLRALRERANQALEEHRRRLGDIESQLGDRVRQLAEEFGATLGAPQRAADDPREQELSTLRLQVEEGRLKHEKFVEQLIAARKQLDAIQSQPCASCQAAAEQLAVAEQEIHRLQQELQAAVQQHVEDRTRHDKFVEQLAAARQAINVLQHTAGESSTELRGELEAARAARVAAEEHLAIVRRDQETLEAERDAGRVRIESLGQDLAAAHVEHARLADQMADAERQKLAAANEAEALRREVDELRGKLSQAERDRAALGEMHREAEGEQQAFAESLAAIEAEAAAVQAELSSQLAATASELEGVRQRLAGSESDKLKLDLAVSQSEAARLELQKALAAAESRLDSLGEQASAAAEAPALRAQLETANAAAEQHAAEAARAAADLEEANREIERLRRSTVSQADIAATQDECQQAQAAIAELQATTTGLRQQAAELEMELASRQAALAEQQAEVVRAQEELAAARRTSRPSGEFAELEGKFELALADVQKLKRENSGLREELARRPETSSDESPDLIAVRSERDVLAARVSELEAEAAAAAAAAADGDAQQERDDLQRRFEMAVDDVRQLKQENAELRDKLAAAGSASRDVVAASGGGDWASQRAKLMAMLEEEDEAGPVSPGRTAERATVTKTIAATDRVIANKDAEIAELQAALATRAGADVSEGPAAAHHEEILGADELIVAERQRLTDLAAEWEEKLRAAELEFSIERAKLAREQAALRERTFELESLTPPGPGDAGVDPHKPRRRWLSALGLGDEAEPKKK